MDYDVIVAGAGNGGLAAAATLAAGGLKVLVLEKHNLPGGCASSFIRGRFEFETALHELCLVGNEDNPQEVYRLFSGLGLDIHWHYDSNLLRAIVKGENGYDVTLKGGREGFLSSMEEAVPGSSESLRALLKVADSNDETSRYLESKNYKPNRLKVLLRHRNFMRSASHSLSEVEEALHIPARACSIINTYWSYLGTPSSDINAMHFLCMLKSYIDDGPAMPQMRSHELSSALVSSILKNGGQVRMNCPVSRFLTDDSGRVTGVSANGEDYYAKEIVSNIIPNSVYHMMDKKAVPRQNLRLANAQELAVSAYTIYLGLDRNADELGINDYTVFIMEDEESEKQHDNRSSYIVNCLNKVIPDCSPEGTCMLFFTVLCYGNDIPDTLKPEEYRKFKFRMAEKYIRDYEETLGLDIRSHIEEIEIATPVTFARYLGTPGGTIYGYKLSRWDNLIARILDRNADNSIPGLTFVGGHTDRGNGYNSTYSSGVLAAESILERIGGTSEKI